MIYILGLINHVEQRKLFLGVDIGPTVLGTQRPAVKDKLIHKLDLKIYDLVVKLDDKLQLMLKQKIEILALLDKVKLSGSRTEFDGLSKCKNAQLSTAHLVEFCFDLEQLYITSHHTMEHFISSRSKSGTFLSLQIFEKLLEEYFLIWRLFQKNGMVVWAQVDSGWDASEKPKSAHKGIMLFLSFK